MPVVINDKITLDFTLDSGASDVSVPTDVVLVLMRMGTIRAEDYDGQYRTYTLADGSTVRNRVLKLRSLSVAGIKLTDVEASVTDVKGSLLLGQSFLKRLGSWSINNRTDELVLEP